MAKIPDNNNKNGPPESQVAESGLQPDKGGAMPAANSNHNQNETYPEIGAYARKNPYAPDLSSKAWEDGKDTYIDGRPWADDPKKRLAIRAFSRGVLGAAFFTAGSLLTRRWMHEYPNIHNPNIKLTRYDASKSLAEQMDFTKEGNPLKVVAKLIDMGVGKPLEMAVNAVAPGKGGAFVRFRPTFYKWNPNTLDGGIARGRSLGDEVVNITFDFFAMSVGDAIGRDVVGWFDPNVKQTWLDDKGNIKVPETVKALSKSWWRYVSYNGGEDWAVGIPYAYYMKWQRGVINRFSPGFMYDSDRQTNGGSHKLDDQHNIVGNYNKEGMIDFQGRFTAYNVGTLMYRELYHHVADLWNGKPAALYGTPDIEGKKKQSVMVTLAHGLKWVARSVIKGVIVMTPTVPFFWITRVPQSKHLSYFIHPEKGVLNYQKSGQLGSADPSQRLYEGVTPKLGGSLPGDTQVLYSQYTPNPNPRAPIDDHFRRTPLGPLSQVLPDMAARPGPNGASWHNFDAYGRSFGPVDSVFNKIGQANWRMNEGLDRAAERFDRTGAGERFNRALNIKNTERFTRSFILSSIAYTPYMYTKAEFGNLWDTGKMDLAAERLIDGATKFNWGEFKAGAGEVWNSILRRPLDDPQREAEAEWRIRHDNTPADVFLDNKEQQEAEEKIAQKQLNPLWQDRIFAGSDKSAGQKTKGRKKKDFVAEFKPNPQLAGSYADQESLQKLLQQLTPPTPSKH